jgi:hypothetical protein
VKRNILYIVIFFLLVLTNSSFACYYDTGWKTYLQPNGVKFTARMWGDEYESHFETKDGFSLDKNNEDGYYYYAGSSDLGRFILTKQKVGIDIPTGIQKNLVKKNPFNTRSKITTTFNNSTRLAKTAVTTYKLKVLLVEFLDVHGDVLTVPHWLDRKSS